MTTIRSIVVAAANKGWKVCQLDIKPPFLNGDLEEEIHYLSVLAKYLRTRIVGSKTVLEHLRIG